MNERPNDWTDIATEDADKLNLTFTCQKREIKQKSYQTWTQFRILIVGTAPAFDLEQRGTSIADAIATIEPDLVHHVGLGGHIEKSKVALKRFRYRCEDDILEGKAIPQEPTKVKVFTSPDETLVFDLGDPEGEAEYFNCDGRDLEDYDCKICDLPLMITSRTRVESDKMVDDDDHYARVEEMQRAEAESA